MTGLATKRLAFEIFVPITVTVTIGFFYRLHANTTTPRLHRRGEGVTTWPSFFRGGSGDAV